MSHVERVDQSLSDLRYALSATAQARLGMELDPERVRANLGPELYDELVTRTMRVTVLQQLEQIAEFVLEVVRPSLVGESKTDLLGSVADEMESLGKFPHLSRLRAVLEAQCNRVSSLEVRDPFDRDLALAAGHESSPLPSGLGATHTDATRAMTVAETTDIPSTDVGVAEAGGSPASANPSSLAPPG